MAMLPTGVQITKENGAYLFCCDNVYVMPGIPAMVDRAIEAIGQKYAAALRSLATAYFSRDEWDSVAEVDRIVAHFEDLTIGSYPLLDSADHRHRVTFEGEDPERIKAAVQMLIEDIGKTHHVRTLWREDDSDDQDER